MKRKRKTGKIRDAFSLVLIVMLVLTSIAGMYLSDGYEASDRAEALCQGVDTGNTSVEIAEDYIAFKGEAMDKGVIFYPGALVDHKAYAPLMKALAERGILGVDVSMPLDLAILKKNAADKMLDRFQEEYPEIKEWYICGHSLGGAMAADYAAGHANRLKGLILLAAYSTKDLKATGLKVLDLRGSKDGVLNQESYDKYKDNLPADTLSLTIEGGCHAGFGDYGPQDKDGEADISTEDQITYTADTAADWMK